jgi:hypothetical protein
MDLGTPKALPIGPRGLPSHILEIFTEIPEHGISIYCVQQGKDGYYCSLAGRERS